MQNWLVNLGGSEFRVMRMNDAPIDQPRCDTPERCFDYLTKQLPSSVTFRRDVENLMVILLSTRRQAIGFEVISNGSLDTLLVSPREVFKPAIVCNASVIVLAHNHPSGDPTPGQADIKITRDLIRAGQLLQIEVLDHIVLGQATKGQTQAFHQSP